MATPRSGQVTVTSGSTAVRGTSIEFGAGARLAIKGHPGNSTYILTGNDGSVAPGTVGLNDGFALQPGELIVATVKNLNELWFNSPSASQKAMWFWLD